jgi:hypothetical protein
MKYVHINNTEKSQVFSMGGAVTVAYTHNGPYIYAAFAFCSPEDNFSKKIGRVKSSGRHKGNHVEPIKLNEGETPYDAVWRYLVEDFKTHVPADNPKFSTSCLAPFWLQGEILSDLLFGALTSDVEDHECFCAECDCEKEEETTGTTETRIANRHY